MGLEDSSAVAQKHGFLEGIRHGIFHGGSFETYARHKELREGREQRDIDFDQKRRDRAARKNDLQKKWSAAVEERREVTPHKINYRVTCLVLVVVAIAAGITVGALMVVKNNAPDSRGGAWSIDDARGGAAAEVVVTPNLNFPTNVEAVCTKDKVAKDKAGYNACKFLCEKARCCFLPRWFMTSCSRSEPDQCKLMKKSCRNLNKDSFNEPSKTEASEDKFKRQSETATPQHYIVRSTRSDGDEVEEEHVKERLRRRHAAEGEVMRSSNYGTVNVRETENELENEQDRDDT